MYACILSHFSRVGLCNAVGCSSPGSSVHGTLRGKNTGVGCHALLQGIFPTQESNPGLPCCGQVLYRLSHQGSLRILEWIAMPCSRGSSWPRDQTWVSHIAGRFSTIWASREAPTGIILPPQMALKVPQVKKVLRYWWSLLRLNMESHL